MRNFPIILIPVEIQRVMRELPPIPYFSERLPKRPEREPRSIDIGKAILETTILFAIAGAISWLSRVLGTVVLLVGIVAIVLRVRLQAVSYSRRLRDYGAQLENYFKLLEAYSRKESQHQMEIALSRSPERLRTFRRSLLEQVLESFQLSVFSPDRNELKEGVPLNATDRDKRELIEKFGRTLEEYFPDRIRMDMAIAISNSDSPSYLPDFTYIDALTNLHVAIEVEEPYDRLSKEPKHFYKSWHDERSNQCLLQSGWIVVRFSEEQVVRSPRSCCKELAKIVSELLGDNDAIAQFADIADLPAMRQWTEKEARQMAASAYRRTYYESP